MTIFILKIIPRKGKRQEIISLLDSVENHAQLKGRCLECSHFEQRGEEGRILYMEHWHSSQELEQHIQSSIYLRILTAMELAAEAPQINFYEVSETKGLELVESLRITQA